MAGHGRNTWRRTLKHLLFEAALISAASTLLGLTVNLFHPRRIPFVAERDYDTLVPCPVPGGPVEVCPSDAGQLTASALFVDARSAALFAAWHPDGAMNIVYDYLEPVPEKALRELSALIRKRKPRHIAVYGDGRDPDSGEQLGRELSGGGFKNVCFVRGGAGALQARLQEILP